jgi:UDP-glucuronate decarboxylase
MKPEKQQTVLVAGGAGFIGSNLVEALLADGHRVICLDNFLTGRDANFSHLRHKPGIEIIRGDIVEAMPASLMERTQRIDRVFNFACAASPPHYQADPEHTLLTSIVGTRNLLLVAERHGARFLQASTSEVYGDPEVHPQPETYWGNVNPVGPRACYDEGKRAAETLIFDYARAGRVDVRVVRIFNTYGPRMRADDGRVVSNVITQALSGEDITVYGSGEQTRSFCYVDDLVDGILRLMAYEGDHVGPVNLGNPDEMTVRELVSRVLSLTGSRSRVVSRPLPEDDPQRRRPDISLAERLLDWRPRVALEDGLKRTIPYFAALLGIAQPMPAAGGVDVARRDGRIAASPM